MDTTTNQTEALIIGAGAAGLMAARELAKAGKKITILEARDRIGGRIFPLEEEAFGYPAQGGAEFVHGIAPVTKALIDEAGLTFIPEAHDGEVWDARSGPLSLRTLFIQSNPILKDTLERVQNDISIAEFLETYFDTEEYANLRNSILKMVEGYEAADPRRVSVDYLRRDVLGKLYHADGWIREGYGKLLNFLEKECKQNGVEIILNACVTAIDFTSNKVRVKTDNKSFEADQVIVTVPLPILKNIEFIPDISEKLALTAKIGFGPAIKLLIKFKSQWWKHVTNHDLSKLSFALCNDDFTAWWTQYPVEKNIMVGWMAGPNADKNKELLENQLLDLGLLALSNMFNIDNDFLKNQIETWKVVNWPKDPYALGAYSYTAMDTGDAYEKLVEPLDNKVFFAGEALYTGEETATVEGALGSGNEVAEKILKGI
ncbi:FAD-dependent oxidoreductase [Candidatus Nomurabacteria bacterium]|jgi:monoamine oxidase|nr:MAG: FAD-dependent oxidoreductase [Candidatus Nomurabacteria bacterium]